MLETIREFALERLEADEEAVALRERHASHCLALAERVAPRLPTAQAAGLARLRAEVGNLLAALDWSERTPRTEATGLRLAAALWWHWETLGRGAEGRARLESLLERDRAPAPSAPRAAALHACAHLAHAAGDFVAARALLEESLLLWRALGERAPAAHVLADVGRAAGQQGDHARAVALLEESLREGRELGDRAGVYFALFFLAGVVAAQGHHERALALHEECLALKRQAGPPRQIGLSLLAMGDLALAGGELRRAEGRYRESLTLWPEHRDAAIATASLEGLARVAVAQERPDRAAHLFGAVDGWRSAAGVTDRSRGRRQEHERAAARAALGAGAFESAWAAGQAMPPEEAVEAALAGPAPAARTPTVDAARRAPARRSAPVGRGAASPLSRRQQEVAALVSEGLTDRQVAARLEITERTAGTHLERIMHKLGAHSRAEIAAWVAGRRRAAVPAAGRPGRHRLTPTAPGRGAPHSPARGVSVGSPDPPGSASVSGVHPTAPGRTRAHRTALARRRPALCLEVTGEAVRRPGVEALACGGHRGVPPLP